MNLPRLFVLSAAIGVLLGCGKDTTAPVNKQPGPAGLLRIVNAVPDTGSMDFRFTDVVDGVPNVEFVGLAFRAGTTVAYQRTVPGNHHIRVFMNGGSTDPAVVSTVMGDLDFPVNDGVAQTLIFYGPSRSQGQKFLTTTDGRPTISATAGSIAIRAVNLTADAVDIYMVPGSTQATAASGAPVITNVAPLSASSYITGNVAGATSGYTVVATTAGTTTVVATVLMPAGTPFQPEVPGVSGPLDPVAGSKISGSVFSAFVFPPSVSGSRAPSFPNPGVSLSIDRNPPRP
ncbi:MAG TPA: DUF4397 domain-containing protein [Gemmatimonadaceae bacterium]|jgi:hypothetical protein